MTLTMKMDTEPILCVHVFDHYFHYLQKNAKADVGAQCERAFVLNVVEEPNQSKPLILKFLNMCPRHQRD